MPTVSYDFNEASDFADFVVLDPGNYVFIFREADATQKSKAGKPKVVVDLIVSGASPANQWTIGGLVRQHWPTRGEGSGRFRDFLSALGYDFKTKGSLKLERYYEDEIGARVSKAAGDRLGDDGEVMFFNDLHQLMPGQQMRDILGLDDEEDIIDVEEEEEDEEVEEVEEEEIDEEDDEEEEDEEEEEEDEEETEEDEAEEDEEEEPDDENEEEEEGEEGIDLEDLDDMNLKALREMAEEYDISTKAPRGKKLTSAILRKRLAVLWEDEEEDNEEDEEDPF